MYLLDKPSLLRVFCCGFVFLVGGFFLSCGNSDNHWILPAEELGKKRIHLDYGNPIQGRRMGGERESTIIKPLFSSSANPQKDSEASPGPEPGIVYSREGYSCLYSRLPHWKDQGPRLRICLEGKELSEMGENLLDGILHPTSSNSYLSWSFEDSSGGIQFEYITEIKLRNLWRRSPPRDYLLGDKRLKKFLGREDDLGSEEKSYALSYSYGLPYWNYYGGEECFFFLSTWDVEIPANRRRVLKIGVDCESIQSEWVRFLSLVEKVNEEQISQCKNEYPILTEVFSHSNSRFGRYLEFTNPKEYPICRFQITPDPSFVRGKEETVWVSDWEFLFPGSVVILGESGSRLQSYDWIEGYLWSGVLQGDLGIGKGSEELGFGSINSGFRYEEEYFSRRKNPIPCSAEENYYKTSERFCGSPGVHRETQDFDYENSHIIYTFNEKGANRTITGKFCLPGDLHLTEINYIGIQDGEGRVDTRDRFLEFQYLPQKADDGNNEQTRIHCDPSGLVLDLENQRIPLLAGSKTGEYPLLKPEEVFLVSLSTKLPDGSKIFPRNLHLLNPSRSIHLEAFGDRRKRYRKQLISPSIPGNKNKNLRYVLRNSQGDLHSLQRIDSSDPINNYIHHPKMDYMDWNRGKNNYMSPGWIPDSNVLSIPTDAIAIQEVLWSGSYQRGNSILTDRFVEWKVRDDGKKMEREGDHSSSSFYLELDYSVSSTNPNRNQAYLLPVETGIHFLSRNPSTCFPYQKGLVDSRFSLFNDPVVIRIRNEQGEVLDKVFLDTESFGINDTRSRIRSSAVRIPSTDIWTHSLESDSGCPGETLASPGLENRHPPFLLKEKLLLPAQQLGFSYLRDRGEFPINIRKTWFFEEREFFLPWISPISAGIAGSWDGWKELNSNSLDPSQFSEYGYLDAGDLTHKHGMGDGLLYYFWENEYGGVFQKTEYSLESFSPSPSPPLLPWVQICREKNDSYPITWEELILETDSRSDFLEVAWEKSLESNPDSLLDIGNDPHTEGSPVSSDSSETSVRECGVLIPQQEFYSSDLENLLPNLDYSVILSCKNLDILSSGFSSRSGLDLFRWDGQKRIHLASYGNRYLNRRDTFSLSGGTYAHIRNDRRGGGREGYRKFSKEESR